MSDTLKCPLCDKVWCHRGALMQAHGVYTLRECRGDMKYCFRTKDDMAYHGPEMHAPILLSWPWETFNAYHAFYTDDAVYHEQEAKAIGTDSFWHRDSEYLEANYQRLRWIDVNRPPKPNPAFLDIGTGTGALPSMARAVFGGVSLGYEPNAGMVAQGQCLGRPVKRGTWQDAGKALEDGLTYNDLSRGIGAASGAWQRSTTWDIISLSDVLEHLTHPADCLEHLGNCLNPDGALYIEMPEWDGDVQNKHIKPRQHVCLYSREAAEEFFNRCGYRVIAFHRPKQGTIAKMAHLLMRR